MEGKVLEFPPQGKWTYEDWLKLPDDGWQYEVIDGELFMTPAPTIQHQRASRNLGWATITFVRKRDLGEVFFAPIDVYLPGQETPVQPDIVFVRREREEIIRERGIEGVPDLIVEVLSPASWWKDRKVKYPLYERAGVPELWIVDPEGTVEVYVLRGEVYALLGRWEKGETARSGVLDGFEISVEEVVG